MHKSNNSMVPGQASTHHENAHTADEGGNVAHVGKAIPLKRIGTLLNKDHLQKGVTKVTCLYLRMARVRVTDRLAYSQCKKSLEGGKNIRNVNHDTIKHTSKC